MALQDNCHDAPYHFRNGLDQADVSTTAKREHWKKSANMASQAMDPLIKGTSGEKSRTLIRVVILCIVAAAAVSSRLFSVIRTHETPPP